jgi:hypothetical protein
MRSTPTTQAACRVVATGTVVASYDYAAIYAVIGL